MEGKLFSAPRVIGHALLFHSNFLREKASPVRRHKTVSSKTARNFASGTISYQETTSQQNRQCMQTSVCAMAYPSKVGYLQQDHERRSLLTVLQPSDLFPTCTLRQYRVGSRSSFRLQFPRIVGNPLAKFRPVRDGGMYDLQPLAKNIPQVLSALYTAGVNQAPSFS